LGPPGGVGGGRLGGFALPSLLPVVVGGASQVLDAVVNFLYSGEVGDLQQDAFLLWQLVCLCTQYALPAPLAEHARTALVAVIDEPRHAPVAPVLMQAADKVGLTTEERGFVACAVLRCPAASAGTEGP
ncbi:unnamed protein product, partial [Prorocentrum cordatum]